MAIEHRWRPVRHFAERSLLGLAAVIAAGLGFGLLLLLVRSRWSPLERLDHGAAAGVNTLVAPHSELVTVLRAVSSLGGRPIMMWLVTVAVVLLLIRRRARLAAYLVVAGLGALVLDPSLKTLIGRLRPVLFVVLTMVGELTLFLASANAVNRPRPGVEQLDGRLPTSSFPSGHIAATLCLYTAIAVLILPRVRHWTRWLVLVPAVVMPAGVAVSRMYRGMHHPSDVAGALLLTALWVVPARR